MTLVEVIRAAAADLQPHMPWGDALAVMGAIAEVESSFGDFALPRHEKNFDYSGAYFGVEQRARWVRWGAWAACSYSSFQIMFPTACELGFDGTPMDLWHDDVAAVYVVRFIVKRALGKGATKISQIADTYNSGSFLDRIYPTDYVKKFADAYASVVARRNLRGDHG